MQMIGLVESRVGQGTFVGHFQLEEILGQMNFRLRPSDADLVDLMEMRELLELKAVHLAAGRIQKDDLDEMKDALQRMEENLQRGEPWIEEDMAFHKVIFRASGNGVLLMIVDAITDLLLSVRHAGLRFVDPDDEIAQHTAIYQALKDGDADRASELMAIHMRTAATQMLAAVEIDRSAT